MTAKRAFYFMIAVLGVSVVLVGIVVYFGNKMLAKESNKLVELKVVNSVLETQTAGLAQAQRDIEKYDGIEEITQSIVPQDKDQARAVREINVLANESGFAIKSVTFPSSNLGTKTTPAKPAEGESASPTPQPSNAISQAKPVTGLKGVYSLEATIAPQGYVSYYDFLQFLSRLEQNRRTAQVTRISINPQSENKQDPLIDFTLTVNIFLKP